MNRNNIFFAVLAASLILVIAGAQTDKTEQTKVTVGRYQLQVVEHVVAISTGASAGGTVTTKDVLRFDTATGVTDVWRSGVDRSGQLVNAWSPIR